MRSALTGYANGPRWCCSNCADPAPPRAGGIVARDLRHAGLRLVLRARAPPWGASRRPPCKHRGLSSALSLGARVLEPRGGRLRDLAALGRGLRVAHPFTCQRGVLGPRGVRAALLADAPLGFSPQDKHVGRSTSPAFYLLEAPGRPYRCATPARGSPRTTRGGGICYTRSAPARDYSCSATVRLRPSQRPGRRAGCHCEIWLAGRKTRVRALLRARC